MKSLHTSHDTNFAIGTREDRLMCFHGLTEFLDVSLRHFYKRCASSEKTEQQTT